METDIVIQTERDSDGIQLRPPHNAAICSLCVVLSHVSSGSEVRASDRWSRNFCLSVSITNIHAICATNLCADLVSQVHLLSRAPLPSEYVFIVRVLLPTRAATIYQYVAILQYNVVQYNSTLQRIDILHRAIVCCSVLRVLCELELDHWNVNVEKHLFLYENLRQLNFL